LTCARSVRQERVAENIDLFNFALTADEVAAIDTIDSGVHGGSDREIVDSKLFNRSIKD
jgi:diketogulonate reductase-like aldo/keto reductase